MHILLPCSVCKKRGVFSPYSKKENPLWLITSFLTSQKSRPPYGRIAPRFVRLDALSAEALELLAFWKPEQQNTHCFPIWRPPPTFRSSAPQILQILPLSPPKQDETHTVSHCVPILYLTMQHNKKELSLSPKFLMPIC